MKKDPALGKFPATNKMSFIESHEEIQARSLIDELFVELTGEPLQYRPGGYYLLLKLYVRPEELKEITQADGTKVTLWRPVASLDDDKYQSVAALVCAMGPDAYNGTNADGSKRYVEPWCKVGDWITIPRHESFAFGYRGVAMAILPDDRMLGVISDPSHVTPINSMEAKI